MLALAVTSCTGPIQLGQDLSDYEDQVETLERRIASSPDDVDALRDLGVIHVRTGGYAVGRRYLERARAVEPDHPETLLFLGLAIEESGDVSAAVDVYRMYGDLPEDPAAARLSYRDLMEARYVQLARELAAIDIARLVAAEDTLTGAGLSSRTVGVFSLDYRGQDAEYEPLGRGLSELLSIDLSRVEGITVVERVRLQALVDELALSRSDAVDPATAPRVGRLLRIGTVVGGNFDVSDAEELQVNVASVDIVADTAPPVASASDALRNLFRLEKDIAFAVIDNMDIELTAAERASIEVVPTENLQAFLAFSRGLIQEDAGRFEAASGLFQRAAALDPSFQAAAGKAASSGRVASAGQAGSVLDAALALSGVKGPDLIRVDSDVLVQSRLQNLGAGVQANFIPSPDNRDPLEEAVGAGVEAGGLPAPPPPPPGGN